MTRNYFLFSRLLFEEGTWAALSKSSKAVLPVLLSYRNKKGFAFPSQATISGQAGISLVSVRKGIRGLKDNLPGFSTEKIRRPDNFPLNKYLIPQPAKFPSMMFDRAIITNGTWSKLSLEAKAVYPVVKFHSVFDIDKYKEDEHIKESSQQLIFRTRKWDICTASHRALGKASKTTPICIKKTLSELAGYGLLENIHKGVKIYLKQRLSQSPE